MGAMMDWMWGMPGGMAVAMLIGCLLVAVVLVLVAAAAIKYLASGRRDKDDHRGAA